MKITPFWILDFGLRNSLFQICWKRYVSPCDALGFFSRPALQPALALLPETEREQLIQLLASSCCIG